MRNSQFVTERYVTTVEDSLCAVTKIQIEFQSSVLRTAIRLPLEGAVEHSETEGVL